MPLQAIGAESELSAGSMLLKMLWATGIVVGLILVLFGLARKKISFTGSNEGKSIKVLELRPMINRSTLALVEVHGQKMLLGISSSDIRLLTTITPDHSPDSFSEILEGQQ